MTDKTEASDSAPLKKQPAASLTAAYFIARFGIFLALVALFWLVGFRGIPGALAAAIVSIPVSFYALSKLRVATAERLAERRHEKLELKEEFRTGGK